MQLAWLKVGCIFYFPLKYKTKKGVPPHSEMIFKSNTMKNTLQRYVDFSFFVIMFDAFIVAKIRNNYIPSTCFQI